MCVWGLYCKQNLTWTWTSLCEEILSFIWNVICVDTQQPPGWKKCAKSFSSSRNHLRLALKLVQSPEDPMSSRKTVMICWGVCVHVFYSLWCQILYGILFQTIFMRTGCSSFNTFNYHLTKFSFKLPKFHHQALLTGKLCNIHSFSQHNKHYME